MLTWAGLVPALAQEKPAPLSPAAKATLLSSQEAWKTGKFQQAWALYNGQKAATLAAIREFDPAFTLWLMQRHLETDQIDAAETLGRSLIVWFDSNKAAIPIEQRAQLPLLYADIAFKRQEYARARAQYETIVNNAEYNATPSHAGAQFRIAEIDRNTKQFDAAFERLERMSRSTNSEVKAKAFLQLALLKFDQEEYEEATKYLDEVFSLEPRNAEGQILQAQIFLKTKKLVEATTIRMGLESAQPFVVPGKALRISLEDQNLATVGKAEIIEVRVWTDSGDEEFVNLLPFGDIRSRFEAELATGLGEPKKGDKVLQVLGGEKVYYDFSPAFKKNSTVLSEPVVMQVVSDSEFFASSGNILTAEEQAQIQLEARLRQELMRSGRMKEASGEGQTALSEARPMNQIKPGNPINVRVVDSGRNLTAEKDTVTIKATTSSGDEIAAFPLTETAPHSGVFEGAVPTLSSPPSASALNSLEANPPNSVIAPEAKTPWIGQPSPHKFRMFTVDLKDNVQLGELAVQADVPGRKLKNFLIQTSFNGANFETVGAWPKATNRWQGTPRLELVTFHQNMLAEMKKQPAGLGGLFRYYMESGAFHHGLNRFTQALPSPQATFTKETFAPLLAAIQPGHEKYYLARISVAIWSPTSQTRSFQVVLNGMPADAIAAIAVDGKFPAAPNWSTMKLPLAKGLHRIDAYVMAKITDVLSFDVKVDTQVAPYAEVIPPDMFKAPEIAVAMPGGSATVIASNSDQLFDVKFPEQMNARFIRLVFNDFEGDAPALSRLQLRSSDGRAILPTATDVSKLKENQSLEINPGDKITLAYTNPAPATLNRQNYEALLTATFADAEVNAVAIEVEDRGGHGKFTSYHEVGRFRPDERINVLIKDPDADVSGEEDTVNFTAMTSDGKKIELKARETGRHSGEFLGAIFPVKGTPQKESEIQVLPGQDLTVEYMDRDNLDPGIPWPRTTVVEQSVYAEPEMRIFEVNSQPLTPEEMEKARSAKGGVAAFGDDYIPPAFKLIAKRPESGKPPEVAPALIDGPIMVEVKFPYGVLSRNDTGTLYAQTESGRQAAGKEPGSAFDPSVPGTIQLSRRPDDFGRIQAGPGYSELHITGLQKVGTPLQDGRFSFEIPIELGTIAQNSLVDAKVAYGESPKLTVRGGDKIYVAFKYKDDAGKEQWVTGSIQLNADAFLNVMDRRYRETVTGLHVGESLYLSVLDKSQDRTVDKDRLTVEVSSPGAPARQIELAETTVNSGLFRGVVRLVHPSDKTASPEDLVVEYGAEPKVAYKPSEAASPLIRTVTVFKGANGEVVPFTKTYEDPDLAVQTQFTAAEAYFEMAKKHRELGQEELAQREIAQGKRVLEETMRDFPDTKFRAQADYLLANLALELGDMAKDSEAKKRSYLEAISQFTSLVANFPDSTYAPKSQYKKALTFEKMGDIDQACEEYVKLSYRFPDNELVAETIARLGQYFLTKGKEMQDLAAKEKDLLKKEKGNLEARKIFQTAAEVFSRLSERFPSHQLAAKAQVLSGQCYMRAEEYPKAVAAFTQVVDNAGTDKDVRAEAMYWMADCYVKSASSGEGSGKDMELAYRGYKKLTWDYPESVWAKYARGRLTDKTMMEFEK